ncbi:hypothetical protein ACET3X_003742 [Alternaria dauci]|uniref:Pectinesterase n=1 Tax=Alternaria dauci TaxID=48095 RepID=A0ABR3UNP8_9PLEO
MVFQLKYILAVASVFSGAFADKYSRTKPERGALVVDATGATAGSYLNISAAVDALHNLTTSQKIFIHPGIYKEQVFIPAHQGPIIIQGYTKNARGYKDNKATLTNNFSRQMPELLNNDATATLRLHSPNVRIYNLNIANTAGQFRTNGQALAISAQKTNQGFYGCQFTGYQDTILANAGRQIYAKSFVNGAVDFIFGQRAIAWFHKLDIQAIGPGYITANGREAENNTSIYVFNEANVSGTNGTDTTVLGRPWRPFSRVVFQKSYLSDVVKPEGWARWDNTQSTEDIDYREYQNYGPGANTAARANFSTQAVAPIQASDILGKDFQKENWVDADYL